MQQFCGSEKSVPSQCFVLPTSGSVYVTGSPHRIRASALEMQSLISFVIGREAYMSEYR